MWLAARDATGGSAGSAVVGLAVSLASHSTVAGVITGGVLWVLAGAGVALRVWWRGFRGAPGTEVDPWALPDPWRQLVGEAVASERRFAAAASTLPAGPLRDRVEEMRSTVHAEVLRVWGGARQGATLTGGYPAGARTPTAAALAGQLRAIQEQRAAGRTGAGHLDGAEEAVATQLREARHGEAVAAAILDGLRTALARLDAAVNSLAELATGAVVQPGIDAGASSIDAVATDLSALRSGLDEIARALPEAGISAPGDP